MPVSVTICMADLLDGDESIGASKDACRLSSFKTAAGHDRISIMTR
jgi:hypothetical protein